MSKSNIPDLDEMMQNEKNDDFNTLHLRDFQKARLEIQAIDIPQNGWHKYNKYHYTLLEDMIRYVEPILLKNNLVSNFTEIDIEEGNKQVKIQYRMRITHSINRQFFESKITGYADREIQKIGTLMTYARRYLYESILLIRGEPDLDGDGSLIAGEKSVDLNKVPA
tara:strand:- start:1726 stop:2223 length:498 start_codon:yes stop_codon:yes gene_type:complete